MCGFTGYNYLDTRKETSNKAIREMLAIQKHRGPDDSGIVGVNTQNKSFEAITISEDATFKSENSRHDYYFNDSWA